MGKRFSGSTIASRQDYRGLASEVEEAYARFRSKVSNSDLERQFITRLINTLERLGDCNLFGDPEVRDVCEAFDDYRRALSLVHLLRGIERDQLFASLLYKQAIALCAVSPIRNPSLALQMCTRADVIFQEQAKNATGSWQALGELSTKYVEHVNCVSNLSDSNSPGFTGASPTCDLRKAIVSYRDKIADSAHRDQLELCLYFSRGLVESGINRDSYQEKAECDIFLSFCRLIIDQSRGVDSGAFVEPESTKYLRTYFDCVMESKLSREDADVKELIQIQAETNYGRSYIKPAESTPIIATYLLKNQYWLLVDVPRKNSFCTRISDQFDTNAIRAAASGSKTLPLPPRIEECLESWHSREAGRLVDIRFMPPPIELSEIGQPNTPEQRVAASPALSESPVFPFEVPAGFQAIFRSKEKQSIELSIQLEKYENSIAMTGNFLPCLCRIERGGLCGI